MGRLTGSKEIAEALGVAPATVRKWATRFDDFPAAVEAVAVEVTVTQTQPMLVGDKTELEAWLAARQEGETDES